MRLKMGLPKGSLQQATIRMLKRAGFAISVSERSYLPSIDDPDIELILLRAQEMPGYVQEGVLDCGITGEDWIMETDSDVVKIEELIYSKQGMGTVKWVLAVPEGSNLKSVKDLKGKRIATELVNVTEEFLRKQKVKANVEFSWGATEGKVGTGVVDAIVELTETGKSLKAHRLREIATVCESATQLIANKRSWRNPVKREKVENIAMLLKGAISAEDMVGLKMNVGQKDLKRLLSILPAMKKPTVSNLSQTGWFAVETVIEEKAVRVLIPKLKKAGAEGIVEYPLNKVIY